MMIRSPFERPVGFLLDARDSLNSIEQVLALHRVLDIGVNEKGVCLQVDVFHHNLEAIEASSFCSLNLV